MITRKQSRLRTLCFLSFLFCWSEKPILAQANEPDLFHPYVVQSVIEDRIEGFTGVEEDVFETLRQRVELEDLSLNKLSGREKNGLSVLLSGFEISDQGFGVTAENQILKTESAWNNWGMSKGLPAGAGIMLATLWAAQQRRRLNQPSALKLLIEPGNKPKVAPVDPEALEAKLKTLEAKARVEKTFMGDALKSNKNRRQDILNVWKKKKLEHPQNRDLSRFYSKLLQLRGAVNRADSLRYRKALSRSSLNTYQKLLFAAQSKQNQDEKLKVRIKRYQQKLEYYQEKIKSFDEKLERANQSKKSLTGALKKSVHYAAISVEDRVQFLDEDLKFSTTVQDFESTLRDISTTRDQLKNLKANEALTSQNQTADNLVKLELNDSVKHLFTQTRIKEEAKFEQLLKHLLSNFSAQEVEAISRDKYRPKAGAGIHQKLYALKSLDFDTPLEALYPLEIEKPDFTQERALIARLKIQQSVEINKLKEENQKSKSNFLKIKNDYIGWLNYRRNGGYMTQFSWKKRYQDAHDKVIKNEPTQILGLNQKYETQIKALENKIILGEKAYYQVYSEVSRQRSELRYYRQNFSATMRVKNFLKHLSQVEAQSTYFRDLKSEFLAGGKKYENEIKRLEKYRVQENPYAQEMRELRGFLYKNNLKTFEVWAKQNRGYWESIQSGRVRSSSAQIVWTNEKRNVGRGLSSANSLLANHLNAINSQFTGHTESYEQKLRGLVEKAFKEKMNRYTGWERIYYEHPLVHKAKMDAANKRLKALEKASETWLETVDQQIREVEQQKTASWQNILRSEAWLSSTKAQRIEDHLSDKIAKYEIMNLMSKAQSSRTRVFVDLNALNRSYIQARLFQQGLTQKNVLSHFKKLPSISYQTVAEDYYDQYYAHSVDTTLERMKWYDSTEGRAWKNALNNEKALAQGIDKHNTEHYAGGSYYTSSKGTEVETKIVVREQEEQKAVVFSRVVGLGQVSASSSLLEDKFKNYLRYKYDHLKWYARETSVESENSVARSLVTEYKSEGVEKLKPLFEKYFVGESRNFLDQKYGVENLPTGQQPYVRNLGAIIEWHHFLLRLETDQTKRAGLKNELKRWENLYHQVLGSVSEYGNSTEVIEKRFEPSTWDDKTNERIKTLHPKIREISNTFINRLESEMGLQFRISDAFRSIEEQNRLYEQGRTTKGNIVTYVRGGGSYHNYGLAVDIVEIKGSSFNYDVDWARVSSIGKELGFFWGGDWAQFKDRPHFQLRNAPSTKSLMVMPKDQNGFVIF